MDDRQPGSGDYLYSQALTGASPARGIFGSVGSSFGTSVTNPNDIAAMTGIRSGRLRGPVPRSALQHSGPVQSFDRDRSVDVGLNRNNTNAAYNTASRNGEARPPGPATPAGRNGWRF